MSNFETNTLPFYIDYFRNLSEKHITLEDFHHGASGDIIGKSRSNLKYPCLWLETPNLQFQDNDAEHLTADRIGAFVILWNAPNKKPEEIDVIWADCEQIVFDVLGRMVRDRKQRKFYFSLNGTSAEAISQMFTDKDFGWRVEFKMGKEVPICFDKTKWKD